MIFRLMAAACCLFIASCAIPFPTNNPLPYTGGEFTRVYVGSTSDDVVELLGQPQIKLQGGSLWVYGRTRAASTDGLGGYTHDYRAILIEFSEGAVASKDIVHGEYLTMPACWSEAHSLCLWPQWDSRSGANDEPKILSRRYSAVTSLREDDEQAKRFEPDDGQCAVYVYSDGNLFSILPVLSIGTARDEPVPMGGYLNFQSPPQRLQLMAGENTADVDCQAGSLHFYKLGKYLATDGDNIHIKSVNPDEGRKAISWRHLLLTW